jgi:hypothetical protein
MRIRVGVPDEHVTPEVVEPVLEAVTRLNEHMIRTGQSPTSHEALAAGAIWRPENMGDEHFDHGGTIASRGWGDCDDWAPLHAATLRANGTDPGAKTIMVPSGPSTFHAIVQRSDGSIEDPSVAAGMKSQRPANIHGEESIQTWACDPHDGRIYQGSLVPAVGPLSLHCGPGIALRGIHGCFEGRVDVPLCGSSLVAVRSYTRHHRGAHHRIHGGAVPYALSITHRDVHPRAAMLGALVGAICCGDASEMTAPIDRYKLLALQSAMAGMSPGQVREALQSQIHADMLHASSQSGRSPEEHAAALRMHVSGYERFPGSQTMVGSFLDDIGHIASSVVSSVAHVASSVAKTAGPWVGTILHTVQAAVSVVPGLGTAVSDVVAAAETAYDSAVALMHGNPLEAGIRAAYNFATATLPGASALRLVLDPVVTALIDLTVKKEPVESTVLDSLLASVPDSPKIGPLSPRSVAASLAHLIVGKLGVKHDAKKAPPPKSRPAAKPPPPPHANVVHAPLITTPAKPAVKAVHVAPIPARRVVHASKPPGAAHAAVHRLTLQSVNTTVTHV